MNSKSNLAELARPAVADPHAPLTVLLVKTCGRFKAIVGAEVEYADFATIAARTAAAKHFGVSEDRIEVELGDAGLTVRVRRTRR